MCVLGGGGGGGVCVLVGLLWEGGTPLIPNGRVWGIICPRLVRKPVLVVKPILGFGWVKNFMDDAGSSWGDQNMVHQYTHACRR